MMIWCSFFLGEKVFFDFLFCSAQYPGRYARIGTGEAGVV